ncbi:hypothetical protein WKV44_10530 [Spirochaetia bacterium 38H-sp]|uniref:Uncharacterized protein n=1 Tax=Rarispira pelagica TaxID=3141764 RepID=A0ABU9UE74_9SPIR
MHKEREKEAKRERKHYYYGLEFMMRHQVLRVRFLDEAIRSLEISTKHILLSRSGKFRSNLWVI